MPKDTEELCGSACLSVVHRCLRVQQPLLRGLPDIWIAQLALRIHRWGVPCRLFCSAQSRLYRDYRKIDHNTPLPEPFQPLAEYETALSSLCPMELTARRLSGLLSQGVVLALVDSAIWNGKAEMKGGHFVVILSQEHSVCLTSCPQRSQIELISTPQEHLLRAIGARGGWGVAVSAGPVLA